MRGSVRAALSISFALNVVACGGKSDPTAIDATPSQGTPEASISPTSTRDSLRLAELQITDMVPDDTRIPTMATFVVTAVGEAFIAPERTFARAPDDDAGACKAAIRVGYALLVNGRPVADADAGTAKAVLEGELFCPSPDPATTKDIEQFRVTLDDSRPFGGTAGGAGRARLEEVIRQIAKDGADALFGQARTRHQDDAAILANLSPTSPSAAHDGIVSESASEAGERRLVAAIPDLVRLAAHPNTRVAVRAGAALGLLHNPTPEVLQALVKMTDGPSPERHIVAIHALADLGTPEARRYLDNIATGHPIAAIRELARERLRALDQPPQADHP